MTKSRNGEAGPDPSPKARLRAMADRSLCCGYGACVAICPEVFDLEDGLVVVIQADVPPGLEAKAAEAVGSCPQGALTLVPVTQ